MTPTVWYVPGSGATHLLLDTNPDSPGLRGTAEEDRRLLGLLTEKVLAPVPGCHPLRWRRRTKPANCPRRVTGYYCFPGRWP
ncbi:hypothetical protein [Streptomyces sp. NPDC059398]|uniref:hypothetical protein n=1 Tax=Streptomyces sp. NPDC059398 TaxID=3346820 RepID=UPI0036CD8DC2